MATYKKNRIIIIAEKNSVIVEIRKWLNELFNINDEIIPLMAKGHLFTQKKPDQINAKWKTWKIEDLPIIPENLINFDENKGDILILSSFGNRKTLFNNINREIKKGFTEIIHAGDPDDEGQRIVDNILLKCNINPYDERITRINIVDLNKQEIISAFKNRKKNKSQEFKHMSKRALVRANCDWLIGMNLSRLMSIIHKKTYSVGRVQTALLGAIYDRCHSFENHVKVKTYGIKLKTDTNEVLISNLDFQTKEEAENFIKINQNDKLINSKIEKKEIRKIKPTPPPYDKISFLSDAMGYVNEKKYHITATELTVALNVLYENLFTSYPRTDCKFYSLNKLTESERIFKNTENELFEGKFKDKLTNKDCVFDFNQNRKYKGNFIFNDEKIKEHAHTALSPTLTKYAKDKIKFKYNDNRITGNTIEACDITYRLITKRFLIQFLPDCIINQHLYFIKIANILFKNTKYYNYIQRGYEFDSDDNLSQTGIGKPKKLEIFEKITRPSPLFNQKSILAWLSINKLGTAATCESFIIKLEEKGFVRTESNNIQIMNLGKNLIEAMRINNNTSKFTQLDINKEISLLLANKDFVVNYFSIMSEIELLIKNSIII